MCFERLEMFPSVKFPAIAVCITEVTVFTHPAVLTGKGIGFGLGPPKPV